MKKDRIGCYYVFYIYSCCCSDDWMMWQYSTDLTLHVMHTGTQTGITAGYYSSTSSDSCTVLCCAVLYRIECLVLIQIYIEATTLQQQQWEWNQTANICFCFCSAEQSGACDRVDSLLIIVRIRSYWLPSSSCRHYHHVRFSFSFYHTRW